MASNNRYIATGSKDETIQLYDMKKKIEQGALLHHDGKSYRDGGKIEFLTLDLCDGLFFFTVCSVIKFIVRTPP